MDFDLSPEQEKEVKKLYFTINYESAQRCIGQNAEQVMVYGFTHAKYDEIYGSLKAPESPIRKLFDWEFGNPKNPDRCVTLEGMTIEEFAIDPVVSSEKETCSRVCKAAVTNLVLENFKRSKKGLPLIPLLFCIESPTTVEHHKLTVQSLTSKESKTNGLITHSELRRVYKLCKELERESDSLAQTLAHLAQSTLKMVRVEHQDGLGETFVMQSVLPVWEQSEWEEAWKKRIQQKSPEVRQKERQAKPHYWKDQLLDRAHRISEECQA